MAIAAGDLDYYLTGAGSDGGAQADHDASLGGYRSSTEITDDTDNNLFDDVSGDEASAGRTEYRCICIKNAHGSLDLTDAVVYLSDEDIGGSNELYFAVEVPTTNDSTGSCQTIGNETTDPTVNSGNVSDWSQATTKGTGVTLDINAHDADLGSGEIVFVWLKRVIAASASAAAAVAFTVKIEGDTAA